MHELGCYFTAVDLFESVCDFSDGPSVFLGKEFGHIVGDMSIPRHFERDVKVVLVQNHMVLEIQFERIFGIVLAELIKIFQI